MSRRLFRQANMFWRISSKNCFVQKNIDFVHKKYNSFIYQPVKFFCNVADTPGQFHETTSFDFDDVDINGAIKTLIKYDESDPIISSMLAVTTVQELFNIIGDNENNLKKSHLVQAVLMLWYFQTSYLKVQSQVDGFNEEEIESTYLATLHRQPQFQLLLSQIKENAKEYDNDELSCSLLYLSKMNVNLNSDTMQCLLNHIDNSFKNNPDVISLVTLSRCCVAFKYNSDLFGQFFLLGLVPHVEKQMEKELSPEDFKLLTTCFLHIHQIVPNSMLDKYTNMCKRLIDAKAFSPESGRIIVKILTLLSLPFWANKNGDIVRNLCKAMENNVKTLGTKEILSLSKMIQAHLEPAGLLEEVTEAAQEYLGSGDVTFDRNTYVGLLTAAAQQSFASKKIELEKMLFRELKKDHMLSSVLGLFQILRSIKTSNHELCHLFWTKVEKLLKENKPEESMRLLRVAHRYMYFNNNMGGTFRNYSFENQIIRWILDEIQFGSFSYIPSKLSRGAAFVIAYCRDTQKIASVIDKVLKVESQLSKVDCVVISRGVEIMLELARRKALPPDMMKKLVELDTMMNKCAWRHLNQGPLDLSDVTTLLRTFFNRRASPDSLLFDTIMKVLKGLDAPLNSRLIRDLSFSASGLNYLLPDLMEKMAAYVVQNEDDVLAETAERVLSTTYVLGYTPLCQREFLSACSRLLQRDIDRLSSLVIIQISLGLSYFHAFPPDLVNTVFSVDFLERIDEELKGCYSKATYPVKVRYTLMELNRSVCLDLPELDVPWFHSKYCEELAALDPHISTRFHQEVKKQLISIVGNENFIQMDVYSPYGYKINFLIHLDSKTKPLLRSDENESKDRVAFLLHSNCQFTLGHRRLIGSQQLRQRHLEMLGYRVVSIPEFVWNAMYLTEEHEKRSFLAQNLWPER